jgi:hypothetical protein
MTGFNICEDANKLAPNRFYLLKKITFAQQINKENTF